MKVQIEAWKDGKTLQLFLYPDEAAYEVLKNHLNADFQSRKIVVTFESGDKKRCPASPSPLGERVRGLFVVYICVIIV
jgi:hypothetical protein